MKISQIITEKYKNQDPNRPADKIDQYGDSRWFDTDGWRHRDGDLPAYIDSNGSQAWFQHGRAHRDDDKPAYVGATGTKVWWHNNSQQRDGDKPAVIRGDGTQEWWQDSKKHRKTGPAVIHPNGDIEFFLNGYEYTEEEWAEAVGMRRHEMLAMKHKLGLH